MAGFLDFLQSPDSALGIALLSAGGPTTDPNQTGFGQRLAGAMGSVRAQQAEAMKLKLLQSQVDENTSQDALRRAQLARQSKMDDYFMGTGGGTAASPSMAAMQSSGAMGAGGGGAAPGGGAIAPGAALAAAAGVPAGAPPPPRGKFAEWSQQYNVPIDALVSDYFSNGGKGIADMLFKAGRPDMKESNGYLYDANRAQPGFLPGVTSSADGKTLVRMPNASGGIDVAPAGGSVNAYKEFLSTEKGLTPGRPYIRADGRMGGQSQLDEIRGTNDGAAPAPGGAAPGAAPRVNLLPGVPSGQQTPNGYTVRGGVEPPYPMAERTGEQLRILQSELARPGNTPEDIAGLKREIARLGGNPTMPAMIGNTPGAGRGAVNPAPAAALIGPGSGQVTAGGGLEFSPQEKAAQAAQQAGAVAKATGEAKAGTALDEAYQNARGTSLQKRMETIQAAGEAAPAKIASYQQVVNLLGDFEGGKLSPTAMDIASKANSLGFKIDKDLPNKEAAGALSRGMALEARNTASGGGMPGAMSDADRNFLASMQPGIEQTAAGRALIASNAIALAKRDQQVSQFARNYETKYGKLDNGFFTQLKSWSDQNPMFGAKK